MTLPYIVSLIYSVIDHLSSSRQLVSYYLIGTRPYIVTLPYIVSLIYSVIDHLSSSRQLVSYFIN